LRDSAVVGVPLGSVSVAAVRKSFGMKKALTSEVKPKQMRDNAALTRSLLFKVPGLPHEFLDVDS
jgi:hypothetical protein